MKNSQNDEFTSDATTSPAPQAASVQAWHMLSFWLEAERELNAERSGSSAAQG